MAGEKGKQPMDFAEVLTRELGLIGKRREEVRKLAPPPPEEFEVPECPEPPWLVAREGKKVDTPAAGPCGEGAGENAGTAGNGPPAPPGVARDVKTVPEPEKEARLLAMDSHLAGLALSGGGIRSATFALGVLQGLASLKILSRFDYLSTVSGGGYIGSWLAAWIKREGDPLRVERQLAPGRIREAEAAREVIGQNRIVDEEPEPVHHLRSYSNYLTPRPGLLSVDTWTVLTIYVRNSVINMLLLLPLTMMFVLAGRFVVWCFASTGEPMPGSRDFVTDPRLTPYLGFVNHFTDPRLVPFCGFAVFFGVAILGIGSHLRAIGQCRARNGNGRPAAAGGAPPPQEPPAGHAARGANDARESEGDRPAARGIMQVVIWPMLAAAVLACWSFTIAPGAEVSRVAGERLPVGEKLNKDTFRLRLPVWPLWVQNLQPNDPGTPFPLLDRLPCFDEDAFGPWAAGGFLWCSAVEFSLWFGIAAMLAHVAGFLTVWISRPRAGAVGGGAGSTRFGTRLYVVACAFIAGCTGGFLFLALLSQILWRVYDQPYLVVTVGPPLTLMTVVAATFVEVWLLGRIQEDDLREWWARACAWLVIFAFGWLVFFGITLYGPLLVNKFLQSTAVRSGAVLGWLATAAGGAFAGRSPATKREGGGWMLKALVRVAPTVFVVGLLVLVSMCVDAVAFESVGYRERQLRRDGLAVEFLPLQWPSDYWNGVMSTPVSNLGLVWVGCGVLVFLASWMSNVNLFSMNSMYASRLIRCYLGASRRMGEWAQRGQGWGRGPGGAPTGVKGPTRRANPVTGFDPRDDMPLRALEIGAVPEKDDHRHGETYYGPHLIINTALNLVSGAELAWQDRKAESFVLTPTHCGSKGTGYAKTEQQTEQELTLGRSVSISGAAVDSNIGLHQSSALIALMTAFNARLGWWIQNPDPATWRQRPSADQQEPWGAKSPSLALPLLWELLGQTDEKKKWVHLSDGGHFENLAVYELIRRRCRYIVCCDAGTDPQASDDNLAAMIRLCRTDFGVRIEIDTTPLAPAGPEKLSRWHCAVGKIRYDDVDGGELPGTFVYLRTSLTGDEPPDVQEYASKNPDFPRQSTLDQFYNEAQFESYRALGYHVGRRVFKDAVNEVTGFEPLWSSRDAETEFRRGNQRLFSAVQRQWTSVPPDQDATFIETAKEWTRFQVALGSDRALSRLARDVYPEVAPPGNGNADPELHAVARMIQIMESAWVGLRLGGTRELPVNHGWLSVFRRWVTTAAFRRYWPVLKNEFGQEFVKFCEGELGVRALAKIAWCRDVAGRDWTDLDEEFAREWPAQKRLSVLAGEAEASWGGPSRGAPIFYLVQSMAAACVTSPGDVVCGVVFANKPRPETSPQGGAERYEVLAWLRRPYRGMGIGSHVAKGLLKRILYAVRQKNKTGRVILEVRYPEEGATRGDEMEYVSWRSFFSHYDLRSPRGCEGAVGGYRVIERSFEADDTEFGTAALNRTGPAPKEPQPGLAPAEEEVDE
jgi:hypothetical protein